jgi:hypothetical protein
MVLATSRNMAALAAVVAEVESVQEARDADPGRLTFDAGDWAGSGLSWTTWPSAHWTTSY